MPSRYNVGGWQVKGWKPIHNPDGAARKVNGAATPTSSTTQGRDKASVATCSVKVGERVAAANVEAAHRDIGGSWNRTRRPSGEAGKEVDLDA